MSLKIGPYKIISELGAGGMGVVYRAIDTQVQREVALKRLRSEFAASAAIMSRFRNEAKLQGRLNHPGIAQLYALYQDEVATCIVMELVDGVSLKDLLPLSPAVTALVMRQILHALHYAHQLGVLHRDIKPENIIIDKTGCVKVMDFGIAHAVGSERMTRERGLVGTIEYMAPERVLGREVTNRSDIYSIGLLLFECLAGRLPMDTVVEYDLLRWHIEVNPPSITDFVDVPATFDAVIKKAMEKDPQARYATCDAMSHDLAQFVPDTLLASSELVEAITAACGRARTRDTVELGPIYQTVLNLLNGKDVRSAERLLRQESERYPGSQQLGIDARLAASILLSDAGGDRKQARFEDTRLVLFQAMMYERIENAEAARMFLRDKRDLLSGSVLGSFALGSEST